MDKEQKNKPQQQKNRFQIKFLAIIPIFILILGVISYLIIQKNYWNVRQQIKNKISNIFKKEDHWICVFLHGNFNTGLGLLSLPQVLQDNLKGSVYVKLVRKLRKDQFFYQEQPILKRGLIKIEPTFNPLPSGNKFAAYPIIAGYKEIIETVKPNKEIDHFYTFGWSGILSSIKRRNDSLRLYNTLSDEVARYYKMGIKPKIRLICHSHGGNVALNLGMVHEALYLIKKSKSQLESLEAEGKITTNVMDTISYLQQLPPKEKAKFKLRQKQLDYLPLNDKLQIDELIIFGTPIQPETSWCIHSPIFNKIFNFYSEQDFIQAMDVFSTKQRYSSQRLENLNNLNEVKGKTPQVFQAKIMIDRNLEMLTSTTDENQSWWNKLALNKIFPSESKDPTHKDLWFLAWNKEFCQPNFPLKPLPMVLLTPLLIDVIEKNSTLNDIDLNIHFGKKKIEAFAIEREKKEVKGHSSISVNIIDEIRKKTLSWKPDNLFKHNTYKRIYTALKKEIHR